MRAAAVDAAVVAAEAVAVVTVKRKIIHEKSYIISGWMTFHPARNIF